MEDLAIAGQWLVGAIPLLVILMIVSWAVWLKFWPHQAGGYIRVTFGLAWLCTAVALGIVIWNGPITFSLFSLSLDDQTTPVLGFLADRLSLVIALLVITVSGVVHLYSLRAMQEEARFAGHFTLLTLVTAEVILVVLSNNLLMLGLFWILKGVTLTFLLAHYRERQASRQAAMYKLRVDLLGDGALIVALALAWKIFGTFDLGLINWLAAKDPQVLPFWPTTILTTLLFVAAMSKSAQFPLHRWLPQSVEAPTPVSALMHAGLVNAGGFLLIRLSPLFLATPLTLGLVAVIGGFTTFYGTLIMLTRNDVKGMLVYSTMGQMGFMMLECGLGAFGLAALHIVAHGVFKANLFLSSGSVIAQKKRQQYLGDADHTIQTRLTPRFFLINFLVLALLFGLPLALNFPIDTAMLLLVFAWFTLSYAMPNLGWLPLSRLLPLVAGFVTLYLLGLRGVELFFAPVVAKAPVIGPVWWLAICLGLSLAGLLATGLFWASRQPGWLNRLLQRLYVRVLFAGYSR